MTTQLPKPGVAYACQRGRWIPAGMREGGFEVAVPFMPGRMDASPQQTDIDSFTLLEPGADGFRDDFADGNLRSPAEMLVEKAAFLTLTIPEMTVLVGGMRAMDASAGVRPELAQHPPAGGTVPP